MKKPNYLHIALLVSILIITITPLALAALSKSYDAETKTITIYKNGNPVGTLQLTENTDFCLTKCSAEIEIAPFYDIDLSTLGNFKKKFYNKLGIEREMISNWGWYYWINLSYPVEVNDWGTCEGERTFYDNETEQDVTEGYNYSCITGNHTEYRTKKVKETKSLGGTLWAGQKYYIFIEGEKEPEEAVEWIVEFGDFGALTEWAWWSGETADEKWKSYINATTTIKLYNVTVPWNKTLPFFGEEEVWVMIPEVNASGLISDLFYTYHNTPDDSIYFVNETEDARLNTWVRDNSSKSYNPTFAFGANCTYRGHNLTEDSCAFGQTVTLGGNPIEVDGYLWRGLQFDGNDNVKLDDSSSLSAFEELVISVWIRDDGGAAYDLLAAKVASSEQYEWDLTFNPDNNRITFDVYTNTGNSIGKHTTQDISDGEWHHVVATWSGSYAYSGLYLYIDGVLSTGNTDISVGSFSGVGDKTSDVYIAGGNALAAGDCTCTMDEMRILEEYWDANRAKLEYELGRYNSTNTNQSHTETGTKELEPDTAPPIVTMLSPTNTTYPSTTIPLNVSLDEDGSWCGYELDLAANVTMTADTDLKYWNTTLTTTAGSHNIRFYCNDTVTGNMNLSGLNNVTFYVNTDPTIVVATLTPAIPTTVDDLVATVNATDPEDSLTINITFVDNSTDQVLYSLSQSSSSGDNTSVTLLSGNTSAGDEIYAWVDVYDGTAYTRRNISSVIIQVVTINTELNWTNLPTYTNKTANYTFKAWGASDSYNISFELLNGSASWVTYLVLDLANDTLFSNTTIIGHSGEVWNVSINTSHAGTFGENSTIVTIQNTAPTKDTATVINITSATKLTLQFNCSFNSSDIDGDKIEHNYNWYKDNVFLSSGSLLTNTSYSKDDVLICEGWANDTSLNSSFSNSSPLTIGNTGPTILIPNIGPTTAYTNDTLNCSVIPLDVDFDSLTVNFTWYNGGAYYNSSTISAISGNLSSALLPSAAQAAGETWNCTTFVNDGTADSSLTSITKTISDYPPILTLQSPNNRTNTTDSTPDFIFNYTDIDGTLGNCILYVNGTNVGSNAATPSGVNTTITSSVLADGLQKQWYVNCSDGTTTTQSEIRVIGIDGTIPVLTIYFPSGEYFTQSLPVRDISLNFSFVESNPDTCWRYMNTSNITIASCANTTINISTSGNLTILIYMNDSSGNIGQASSEFSINLYNASHSISESNVTESQQVTFSLQINSTNITSTNATLYFNNTAYGYETLSNSIYQANFTRTLNIPLSVAGGYEYYWNFTINDFSDLTDKRNVTISQMIIALCDGTYSTIALNFTSIDEENSSYVRSDFKVTFTLWAAVESISRNYSFISLNSSNHTFCISPAYAILNLSMNSEYLQAEGKTAYVQRSYYLRYANITNSTNNINIFMLASSRATSVIIKIIDEFQSPIDQALLKLLRYYPGEGVYKTVETAITSEDGLTVIKIVEEDADYEFLIENSVGTIIKLTTPAKIVCLASPCTLDIPTGEIEGILDGLIVKQGISYTTIYNNNTGYALFTYSDPSGVTQSMRMHTVRLTGYGEETICDTTLISSAGTITCYVGNLTGEYTLRIYREASPGTPFDTFAFGISEAWRTFGVNGLVWAMFFLISIFFAGLVIDKVAAIVVTLGGFIVIFMFGIINLPYYLLVSIIAVGIIMIVKMRT